MNSKNVIDRHASYNISHMDSKLIGFDKLGAWPIQVNFQPWQQTPVPLGAGSLHYREEHKAINGLCRVVGKSESSSVFVYCILYYTSSDMLIISTEES